MGLWLMRGTFVMGPPHARAHHHHKKTICALVWGSLWVCGCGKQIQEGRFQMVQKKTSRTHTRARVRARTPHLGSFFMRNLAAAWGLKVPWARSCRSFSASAAACASSYSLVYDLRSFLSPRTSSLVL